MVTLLQWLTWMDIWLDSPDWDRGREKELTFVVYSGLIDNMHWSRWTKVLSIHTGYEDYQHQLRGKNE